MRRLAGGREQWLVAAGCAAWALAFLVDHGTAAYVVPPLVLLALAALDRAPLTAGLSLAAVTVLAGVVLGVPSSSPALLAASLVAGYAAGRRVPRRRGLVVVAGFVVAALWVDELSVATGLFVAFVFGLTWLFGTLVRRRTQSARLARQEVSTLEREDLGEVTRGVVARERARLAVEAVEVLRSAVGRMRVDATVAAPSLDPAAVERIHAGGAAAVAELRRLLGLLRSTPDDTGDGAAPATPGGGRDLLVDGAPALAAVLLVVLDRGNDEAPHGWVALALGIVPCLALVFRSRVLGAAAAVAAAPVALVLLVDAPMVDGLGGILVIVLLAWSVGGTTARWPWVALTVLAALHLGWVWRDNAGNLPITAATFALPLLAGHAWAERDREALAAQAESVVLLDQRQAEIARAVTEERLRIARELHDVASHAVGVMVLQAGAAQALRTTAPERAREALRTVDTAGAQALTELSLLRELLTGPRTGAQVPTARDLATAVREVADGVRATGLVVDLRLGEAPTRPELAAAAYRVVQEGLTNAARHAPRSRVLVRLAREGGDWVVEVTDDGRGPSTGPDAGDPTGAGATGTGHGLLGLGERVRLLGGELAAGPRAGGGYALCARIPGPPPEAPELEASEPEASEPEAPAPVPPSATSGVAP